MSLLSTWAGATVKVRRPLCATRALHYLHEQWPKRIRFLDDGRYPTNASPCENAIRPFVVWRKNWLFSDSVGGEQASANLYSLIETANASGIISSYVVGVERPLCRFLHCGCYNELRLLCLETGHCQRDFLWAWMAGVGRLPPVSQDP